MCRITEHQSRGTGCKIAAYAPDPGSPSSSETVKVEDLCRLYSALLELLTDQFALALV